MEDSGEEFKKYLQPLAESDQKKIDAAQVGEDPHWFKDGPTIFKRLCKCYYTIRLLVEEAESDGKDFLTACEMEKIMRTVRAFRGHFLLIEAQVESKTHDPLQQNPISYLSYVPMWSNHDVGACKDKAMSYKVSGVWELIQRDWTFLHRKTMFMQGDIYASYLWVSEYARRLRLYLLTVEAEVVARYKL